MFGSFYFGQSYLAQAGAGADRAWQISITIDGAERRVRVGSLTIHDALNDEPNTCRFVVHDERPFVRRPIHISLYDTNSVPHLLFKGTVDEVSESYEGRPIHLAWTVSGIDESRQANDRLPFGAWTNVSASAVATQLVTTFAPTFTPAYVQAGLPPISVNLDSSEGMHGALTQIAKLIGGYFYWEGGALHLFTEEVEATPDPVDAAHPPLDDPPIAVMRDASQLRTRVYGKGHGEATLYEVPAGDSIIPIADAVMFNPLGGRAISETQRLAYTGIQLGGGGGLVGPGAQPSAACAAALAVGSGITSGDHAYAITFVTASGESLPSPRTAITVGLTAAPTTAPTAGSPTAGTGPDPGSHEYAVTFVTGSGETTPGPTVTKATGTVSDPNTAPTAVAPTAGGHISPGTYDYCVTFVTAGGETTPGPASAVQTAMVSVSAPSPGTSASPSAANTVSRMHTQSIISTTGGSINAAAWYYAVSYVTASGETLATQPIDGGSVIITMTTGGGVTGKIDFADIPVSTNPRCTGRKIYRFDHNSGVLSNPASYHPGRLVVTITNNTATSGYSDTASHASLASNALVPSADTSNLGTIALSAIPVGSAGLGITGRRVYRRQAGAGTFKLVVNLGDNTTTTYTDAAAQGDLGGAAPTVSTAALRMIPLSAIPIGGSLVTARKLYRTAAGGAQLKLVTTIADNATTTYTDTVPDASLGANVPTSNTATANQVALSSIPLGAAAVTARKVYRTVASGSTLQLVATLADNTTTTYTDSTADGALGAAAPSVDTSGLAQPTAGQVNPGATSLIMAGLAPFSSTGGWAVIGNGELVIRYTGTSLTHLTGIPVTGIGSIVAAIAYNSTVTAAPALTGVTGLVRDLIRGAPVNIWVQRDDVSAQAEYGIIEHRIADERRGEPSLIALCDADLALFARPIVTCVYACRDFKSKSGKPVTIDLASPAILETLTIQTVDISEIQIAPNLAPKFLVTASNVRFSIEDLMRRLTSGLEGMI